MLLVCPKPLVTNWQREFALWAPELPVSTIEGNPTRRQWLWRHANDAVVIANYETVVRDSADVCDPTNTYDLVVLDEAQRIKNRDNLTNQVVAAIPRSRSWASDGHADRKQCRRPGRNLRIRGTGTSRRDDEAAGGRPRGKRLCLATHEGPSADRLAAKAVSRRRSRAHAGTGRILPIGRGRRRRAASRDEARDHDPARLRARVAAEANLQFRSDDGNEQQAGAARSRHGRVCRQRPQGDRVQPVGANADGTKPAIVAVFAAGISRPDSASPARRGDRTISRRSKIAT